MSRITFLILFVCVGTAHLHAQWEFGLYLGLNKTDLSGDSPKSIRYASTFGPTFGATIDYYVKPDVRLSFQPGYSIVEPAVQWKDVDSGEYIDSIDIALNLIKLPIYFDVISDNSRWHFLGGIDVQILLRQFTKINGEELDDLADLLRRVNPVVYFGLGHRVPIKDKYLEIDLRFGQGILNLSNTPDDETSLVPRVKTSGLEILLRYPLFVTKGGAP